MSDEIFPDPHRDDDAKRAIAHLPGLDVEITHRRSANAEQISIHLRAMPSFEAFGRVLEAGNPFAFWAETARLMWLPFLPWLGPTQALVAPEHVADAPPTLPEG